MIAIARSLHKHRMSNAAAARFKQPIGYQKRWPAQWVQTIVYFDAFTLSYGHAVAGVKHDDWRILIFDIFDVHGITGSLDDGTTGAFRLRVIIEEACGVVARTTENDEIVVFRDGEAVGT